MGLVLGYCVEGDRTCCAALIVVGFLFGLPVSATANSMPTDGAPVGCPEAAARIEVRRWRDTAAAGWNYMRDNQAFEARVGDCVVRWNMIAFNDRPEELSVEIRDQCGGDLGRSLGLHDAVLCRVAAAFPSERLTRASLLGGSFLFAAWQERLALASASSPDWQRLSDDRRRGVLHVGEPNRIFVRLFNESNTGRELVDLLARYGWTLSLTSVEKVFAAKADSLPFSSHHAALVTRGASSVITGAGVLHFALSRSDRP